MMADYYSERLSAERLRGCYDIASPRVQQYLAAEIDHVLTRIRKTDLVLELGCGYGRVLRKLAPAAAAVVGIDTLRASLQLARETLSAVTDCHLARMDAMALGFRDHVFDVVACIQNGISAFGVDRRRLLAEAVRVTRPGGRVLFSSYADGFWNERLLWFRLQSEHGLLGEINWDATGNGVIVCKDGFRATTVTPDDFQTLVSSLGVAADIQEVDGSSVFCEIVAPAP